MVMFPGALPAAAAAAGAPTTSTATGGGAFAALLGAVSAKSAGTAKPGAPVEYDAQEHDDSQSQGDGRVLQFVFGYTF